MAITAAAHIVVLSFNWNLLFCGGWSYEYKQQTAGGSRLFVVLTVVVNEVCVKAAHFTIPLVRT